ncbi:MAG: HAD-IA family hydrolase [Clostridiales Family XIII bacterium]|jgi:pyrophosphatase PpaX|nr:HAD-IA family hydrolase [Clostridiales Family XIII bacterium]
MAARTERRRARVDTVLLDFDGTIMDTNGLIVRSWQHTFRTLTGNEAPVGQILNSFGELLPNTAERFFSAARKEEAVRVYRAYHTDCFEDAIELFPGILELLQTLKAERYLIGLVTSRLAHTTRQGLKKYDLCRYFDSLVTEEDTEKPKPDPAPILLSLRNLGRSPENAVMVGDTLHDIRCARNAGVRAALVSWSLAVPEAAKTGKDAPDFILKTPAALPAILRDLNAEPAPVGHTD